MTILGVILVVSGYFAIQTAGRMLAIAALDSPSRRRHAATVRTPLNDQDCGWSN